MANWYEVLGSMVLQGVVTMRAVGDNYANVVVYTWSLCEPAIVFMRAAFDDQSLYECFEYLTARSQEWTRLHPSVYPANVPRIATPNAYPIE